MTPDPLPTPTSERDGTSQLGRMTNALRPDYVSVDERSVADLVAFAKEYGKELRYFDLDNRVAGDWGGFIPDGLTPTEIADFASHPDGFRHGNYPQLFRPHLTLFMTFLKLVEQCQTELNGFTKRHLDHYFRDVLRMTPKAPVADSVNVIIEPSRLASDVLVPAGTLLSAGQDSIGRERTYATRRDLVVNQAQIEKLSSVHVERTVTDLARARQNHRGDRNRALMAMLRLALGEDSAGRKTPGEALPAYPGTTGEPDGRLLDDLKELVAFAESNLHMKLFELRDLMRMRRRSDTADWAEINRYLAILATSTGNSLTIDETRTRDFETNLLGAVGGVLPDFSEVPEVDTIYDLYDFRTRQDVRDAIRDDLGFSDVEDFVRMMQVKVRIDGEWRAINRIIEAAGRRAHQNAAFEVGRNRPDFERRHFERNVQSAIGDPTYPERVENPNLDSYYDALLALEAYFSMMAEEFLYVMQTADGQGSWPKVDEILTSTHRRAIYAQRRAALQGIREEHGVDAMLRRVLGDQPAVTSDPRLVTRIERYLGNPQESEIVRAAHSGEGNIDWERVYIVAEIAQRNREELIEPSPERREWINLHVAADATAMAIPVGTEGGISRWPTFGTSAAAEESADDPSPLVGWAVSSPILELSEGTRIVELTLAFDGEPVEPNELAESFAFDVSTEAGWVAVTAELTPELGTFASFGELGRRDQPGGLDDDDLSALKAVRFRFELDQKFDPITPLPDSEPGVGTGMPILRITLRRLRNGRFMRYSAVSDLRLVCARLHVQVAGLADLRMRNDDGDIDPSGPFEPFSSRPSVGSRFVIGHAELATKKLDSLTFHYQWMGTPPNLQTGHYTNYPIGPNPQFTTDVILVDRRAESKLSEGVALFSGTAGQRIDLGGIEQDSLPDAATDGDLTSWDRYLAWELRAPDFQHGAHTSVATQKSIDMAAAISRGTQIVAATYQVNPPYTPRMRNLVADYTSSVEIRLDRPRAGPDELFHVHPFGFGEIRAAGAPGGASFMPRYDNEGELYIGLRGVRPPQTVALLFQMAEGSASPDVESATVRWSYATGGQWRTLDDGHVSRDTTRGLISSGIVELALGKAEPTTMFTGDLYWVRALVTDNSAGVADTIAIHTQSVSATFVDRENAADHYAKPLPAGSITKTVDPVAGIAAVTQPYTSMGGRTAEADDPFATRVSERLRHKQRALTIWDYEHLTLEQFPAIFKVKCIPVDTSAAAIRPGTVEIVVIPDIRNRLPFNSFEPKAPPELLAEIHEYLEARSPETAVLAVRNASYRYVRVAFGVRFTGDGNAEFYKRRLTDELDRYLSPWAYDEGADIVIGSKIYATSLVDFIDRRPYVDFVADVRLFYSDDGERYELASPSADDGYHIAAGRPDGVLRASPQHEIVVIGDDGYRADLITGIGFMKVELDLIVG